MTYMNAVCPISGQSGKEEILNSVTHGIGVLLSIVGLVFVVVLSSIYGNVWHIVSCSVYGSTMVLLYSASTWYHGCRGGKLKGVLQVLDHICISLFIAGSYTPFALVSLHGTWGWSLFGVIWGMALVELVLELFFAGKSDLLSTIIYLAMGWVSVIAIVPLVKSLSLGGSVLFISGGIAYSLGTIFYLWEKLPFNHSIWHLFVLAGSICHYCTILFYVVPMK